MYHVVQLVGRGIFRVVNEECWTTPDLPMRKRKNHRQNMDYLSKNTWWWEERAIIIPFNRSTKGHNEIAKLSKHGWI